MTDLHYIYFSTKSNRTSEQRLQAVAGPSEMLAALHDNKKIDIYFWCSDCDVEFFQNYFGTRVTVLGCVAYLEKCLENYKKLNQKHLVWSIERLLKVMMISEHALIQDLDFVKNIFAFFILYTQGGYVLDVNVFPYGIPEFREFSNYKVVNITDQFNFQEVLHIIPNRKFFSSKCIIVTNSMDEHTNESLGYDIFKKLGMLDSTYYKNYDELDFQKESVTLEVLDSWLQFSKSGDSTLLQALEYCLRVWPLLCKERLEDVNKSLERRDFRHYSRKAHLLILSSIYNSLLHKKGWFFTPTKCRSKISEKYFLLSAFFYHAKKVNPKELSKTERAKRGGLLIKDLNVIKNFDVNEEILEKDFLEINREYVKFLSENDITDQKEMEWWWQL